MRFVEFPGRDAAEKHAQSDAMPEHQREWGSVYVGPVVEGRVSLYMGQGDEVLLLLSDPARDPRWGAASEAAAESWAVLHMDAGEEFPWPQ